MGRKNGSTQTQTDDNPAQAGVEADAPTGDGHTPAMALPTGKSTLEGGQENPNAEGGGTRGGAGGGQADATVGGEGKDADAADSAAAQVPAAPVVPEVGNGGEDASPIEDLPAEDASAKVLKARLKQERIDAAREECLANNKALVGAMLAKDKALEQMNAAINGLQAKAAELNRVYNEALNG